MKLDIGGSGFMTTWWHMVLNVWLPLKVLFPKSKATGSRPIGGTAVDWRIC